MHTLLCYYCLFCPISILLHTVNSTLYFVSSRTEDDRRTVETCFWILKVSLIFLNSLHISFYLDLLTISVNLNVRYKNKYHCITIFCMPHSNNTVIYYCKLAITFLFKYIASECHYPWNSTKWHEWCQCSLFGVFFMWSVWASRLIIVIITIIIIIIIIVMALFNISTRWLFICKIHLLKNSSAKCKVKTTSSWKVIFDLFHQMLKSHFRELVKVNTVPYTFR